jgi:hypothetical protein
MPRLTWGMRLVGDYPSSYCTVYHFIVDIHTHGVYWAFVCICRCICTLQHLVQPVYMCMKCRLYSFVHCMHYLWCVLWLCTYITQDSTSCCSCLLLGMCGLAHCGLTFYWEVYPPTPNVLHTSSLQQEIRTSVHTSILQQEIPLYTPPPCSTKLYSMSVQRNTCRAMCTEAVWSHVSSNWLCKFIVYSTYLV